MANPFGSGTAIVIPLPKRDSAAAEPSIDEASTVRVRGEAKPATAPATSEPPEIAELLDRITTMLNGSDEGMTAIEMRVALNEKPDRLQRALTAGLRARRFRRQVSRCRLRYVLNGNG